MDVASTAKPSPTTPAAPAVVEAWPRSAQLALAFLLGSATALLAVYAYSSSRWAGRPADLERGAVAAYRVDLNTADHAELLQLPGVGNGLAERIEEYRREHGMFDDPDELSQVRGVGPATLNRLRPMITARGKSEDEPLPPEKSKESMPASKKGAANGTNAGKASSKKQVSLAKPIDLNRASAAELQQLPGIGPALSRRIVDERQKAPFKSVDDLKRVSGIGPKKLEALRPHVTVDAAGND